MRFLNIILIFTLTLSSLAFSQERTAGGNLGLETNWNALKNLVDQANGNSKLALTLAEAIKRCGIKGTFYSPGVEGADEEGCLQPKACGSTGALIDGKCWYMSNAGQSCTSVCAAHGGYSSATRDYAGSSGTNAQCAEVLNALGEGPVSSISNYCSNTCSSGCGRHTLSGTQFRMKGTTTEGALYGNYRRACACNN